MHGKLDPCLPPRVQPRTAKLALQKLPVPLLA